MFSLRIDTASAEPGLIEKNRIKGKGFRADIQGLRAVAVGGVVLNHISFPHLGGGYAGVDVFFVISGFLITDHLAREFEAGGGMSLAGLGKFYARRARRILPASLVVVLLTLAVSLVLLPVMMRKAALHDAIATALYVPNYLFAHRATDYFSDPTPSLYQHYWSLGVEEQFYLVWPLIMATAYWLAYRASKPSLSRVRSPRAVLLAAAVVVGLVSAWLNQRDLSFSQPSRAFFWATGRAWEFAVGGCAALIMGHLPDWWRRVAWIRVAASWIGLACIGFAFVRYTAATSWPGIHAALPVLGAALLILSGTPSSGLGAGRVLALQPLPWIGTLSYSIYLVHWPLIQFVQANHGYGFPLSPQVRLGLAALSIPVAWLLYRFVENPVRFAPWLRPTRRTLFVAAVSSLVAAALAIGLTPIVNFQTRLLASRLGAAEHVSMLTAPPTHITTFVPRNLDPAIGAPNASSWLLENSCLVDGKEPNATTPHPCYLGDQRHPRIALVGDSEAAAMGPALAVVASRLGLSLEADTNSGCEFALDNPVGRPGCPAWRQSVLARLRQDPPEFIVMVEQGHDGYIPDGASPAAAYQQGLAHFLDQVGGVAPVVIIQIPLLQQGIDIPTCLSTYLSAALKCSIPAQPAIESNAHKAEAAFAAAHPDQVHLVDLTGYFCDRNQCPPIIGNTGVWLDDHHPTAAFATLLGPIIISKLAGLGINGAANPGSHKQAPP